MDTPFAFHELEFLRFLASPRHSSSKLGSALGSHINWNFSDFWLRLGIAQASLALHSART